MSTAAESWARDAADQMCWPSPCLRRTVFLALAERHQGGPVRVCYWQLARELKMSSLTLWAALMELYRHKLIDPRNLGGDMSVLLAPDFPHCTKRHPSAEGVALPQSMEAAE